MKQQTSRRKKPEKFSSYADFDNQESLYDFLLGKAQQWIAEKHKGIEAFGSNLKEEFKENPRQTVKDVILSIPRGAAHLTKGAIDIPLSALPETRKKFDKLIDDMDEAYIEEVGIRPNSASSSIGKVGGTLAAPAIKTGKILASGIANATLYGAADRASEGASLEEMIQQSPKDALIGTVLSLPVAKAVKRANKNTDIMLKSATRSPQQALKLQEKVKKAGGNLSLGHALNAQGPQERFERMNMLGSGVKRDMEQTKGAINQLSKQAEKDFPNQARELGQSIQKNFDKVKGRSSDLYKNSEQISHAVEDLLLSPEQLDNIIRSPGKIKNAPAITRTPELYGLTIHEGDKANKLLKAHYSRIRQSLKEAWNHGNPKPEYFDLYKKSGLPNYLDLQDYYHDLNRYANKHHIFDYGADWKVKQAWQSQMDPIKAIIEDIDQAGKFQKANRFWKEQVLPYKKEKEIWKSAGILEDSDSVSPVFELFRKEGNINAEKIFNQLSEEDKRRVLGMMFHKNRKSSTPLIRNTYREEGKLPSYITNSNNSETKKLVEEIEDLAHLNTTYSQLQSALKSKGSSADVGRATQAGMAAVMGGPTASAFKTAGTLGIGGVYQNLRKRYLNNPKTLKKYLNPDLLKELRLKQADKAVGQLTKSGYQLKNKRSDQKNRPHL